MADRMAERISSLPVPVLDDRDVYSLFRFLGDAVGVEGEAFAIVTRDDEARMFDLLTSISAKSRSP